MKPKVQSKAELLERIKTLEWENLELLSALESCQIKLKQCQAQILYLKIRFMARES